MGLRDELAGMPPREQAGRLTPIAADLLRRLKTFEPNPSEAEAAVDAVRAWGGGDRLPGQFFSDLIYSEDERGTLRCLSDAEGKPSAGAWNALTTLTMYVAWLVYQETREPMPSDVNEVDEDTLDLLDTQLGELA